jgi:hypothetical protein
MKTPAAVANARKRLAQRAQTPGLSVDQKAMILGMVNALAWAAGDRNCTAIQRLLSSEPMALGRDGAAAMDQFDRGVDIINAAPRLAAVSQAHKNRAKELNFADCGCDWCAAYKETLRGR